MTPDRLGSLERHPASENFGKGFPREQDVSRNSPAAMQTTSVGNR